MAQILKLRRSAIPGAIPSTSSLDFGEIALNTYDGKAYMKRSSSFGEEIVQIGGEGGSFTGSFYGTLFGDVTGSLLGTSSYAIQANTASHAEYAHSSSFSAYAQISNYSNFSGFSVSSSRAITAVSSSYSLSGSYAVNSSTASHAEYAHSSSNATQAQIANYANFAGFAISASRAVSAATSSYSNNINGEQYYAAVYNGNNSLGTGSIYDSGSFTAVGAIAPLDSERFLVYVGPTDSNTIMRLQGDIDSFLELNIYNTNSGVSASSDLVATADFGTENYGYVDLGINSSNYAVENGIGGPRDGYLYSNARRFFIGNYTTGSDSNIYFFVGGAAEVDSTVFFISSSGLIGVNNINPQHHLDVYGRARIQETLYASEITGSLFGTASWAKNSISSSYALTASYAMNVPETASYAITAATASSADDFLVRGTLTAQTIIAQVITSSTEYVTGSTQFGSTLSNTHQFTGSVSVTGSLSVNNNPVVTSNQTGSMSVLSSSYAFTASSAISASNASTASYVPASAVVGLNLSQIATGSVSASVNVNSGSFTITSGSSTFVFVSSSGNIGIGTSSPSYILDVAGGSRIQALTIPNGNGTYGLTIGTTSRYAYIPLTVEGSTNAAAAFFMQNRSAATYTGGYDNPILNLSNMNTGSNTWTIIQFNKRNDTAVPYAAIASQFLNSTNADLVFFTLGSNVFSEKVRIDNSGNLLVGASTGSAHKLDISGSGRFTNGLSVTGSLRAPEITGSLFGTASWALNFITSSVTSASYATSSSYAFTASSAVSASNALTASYIPASGVVGLSLNQIATGSVTASVNINSGSFTITSGSSTFVFVSSSGNVGIGTNTPTYLLDVSGSARFGLNRVIVNPGTINALTLNTGITGFTGNLIFVNGTNGSAYYGVDGTGGFGLDDGSAIINANTSGKSIVLATQGVERARVTPTGSLLVGTKIDSGYKVEINGSGSISGSLKITSGSTLLIGSGNTSATNALTIQNSDGNSTVRVLNDGKLVFSSLAAVSFPYIAPYDGITNTPSITGGSHLLFLSNNNDNANGSPAGFGFVSSFSPQLGGAPSLIRTGGTFAQSANNAGFNILHLVYTINQTGTANGTTRGLYVNPTLTSVADWRSIEWSNNSGWGLYGSGSVSNYLSGSLSIGTTNTGSALTVNGIVSASGFTGSLFGTASWAQNFITSSVTSASYAFTASSAISSSYTDQSLSSSYAYTASSAISSFNAVTASNALTASSADNFLVRGTLTAQTIVAQVITSSTDYVTGSTRFGSDLTNTHQFTGSVSITGSLSLPTLTQGSVVFAGSGGTLTQDNSNFFWDNANKRLGIRISPSYNLDVSGSLRVTSGPVTVNSGPGRAIVEFNNTSNDSTKGILHVGHVNYTVDGNSTKNIFRDVYYETPSLISIGGATTLDVPQLSAYGLLSAGHLTVLANQRRSISNFNYGQLLTVNEGSLEGNYTLIKAMPSSTASYTSALTKTIYGSHIEIDVDTNVTYSGSNLFVYGEKINLKGKSGLQTRALWITSSNDSSAFGLYVEAPNNTITGSLTITQGITGSLFGTASWAQNFITSSVTSASYAFTASSAISASNTLTASFVTPLNQNVLITGSLIVSGGQLTVVSASFDYNQNPSVATGSWQVIASEATGSYRAAFFDYVAVSGSNARAGTVFSVFVSTSVEWTETYTNDIGSTSGLTLQAALSGGFVQLQATASAASWNIRSLVRML